MSIVESVQLRVETPRPGLRVIRVSGRFDIAGAARVVRLVDSQISLIIANRLAVSHIVVDLGEVTTVVPEAAEPLNRAHHLCSAAGVAIHLTGCARHLLLLPLTARQSLATFSSFPTLDVALATV